MGLEHRRRCRSVHRLPLRILAPPYPVPPNAPIEGGGKHRRQGRQARPGPARSTVWTTSSTKPPRRDPAVWKALSGAVFNLRSDALGAKDGPRPNAAACRSFRCWPGELRGEGHALRVTIPPAEPGQLHPPGDPLRLVSRTPTDGPAAAAEGRLSAGGLHRPGARDHGSTQALGLIVADNGSPWYIAGGALAGLERSLAGTAQVGSGIVLRSGRNRGRSSTEPYIHRETAACAPGPPGAVPTITFSGWSRRGSRARRAPVPARARRPEVPAEAAGEVPAEWSGSARALFCLTADGVLELPHAARHLGKALGSEDEQQDHHQEGDVEWVVQSHGSQSRRFSGWRARLRTIGVRAFSPSRY